MSCSHMTLTGRSPFSLFFSSVPKAGWLSLGLRLFCSNWKVSAGSGVAGRWSVLTAMGATPCGRWQTVRPRPCNPQRQPSLMVRLIGRSRGRGVVPWVRVGSGGRLLSQSPEEKPSGRSPSGGRISRLEKPSGQYLTVMEAKLCPPGQRFPLLFKAPNFSPAQST